MGVPANLQRGEWGVKERVLVIGGPRGSGLQIIRLLDPARFAGESLVRSVTYEGIRNTLVAAEGTGFRARFL
jgi:hypothetical protein